MNSGKSQSINRKRGNRPKSTSRSHSRLGIGNMANSENPPPTHRKYEQKMDGDTLSKYLEKPHQRTGKLIQDPSTSSPHLQRNVGDYVEFSKSPRAYKKWETKPKPAVPSKILTKEMESCKTLTSINSPSTQWKSANKFTLVNSFKNEDSTGSLKLGRYSCTMKMHQNQLTNSKRNLAMSRSKICQTRSPKTQTRFNCKWLRRVPNKRQIDQRVKTISSVSLALYLL